ncbi:hypothetical protein K505DRAFT_329774 [Melanomma pulvis-pyrius CBS 109.77]|uniref:Uncharacterized protein n=1 Tax=Melanomma pulvis-pyrius CBS 109.77 TaxID=1314802 RepID=A0A6A6WTR0_9PLEO|nr:hypothetical protein K505DRAFT_329774 [Melanomma pulvis-pyrius CBS 109.77]
MASAPVTHILNRDDYSKHRLVTLPSDPLPALPPSSIRIQSKILGLTTNNLTYAKLGFLMGWWDVYPQPPNTPEPYNDASTYGRISAWGYAEIIESTVADIPAGNSVYGFLPISTLPEDVQVEQTGLKNHIFVTNPYRQHLWKIYNRYKVHPPLAELEVAKTLDFLGWDALMEGLFATSYNLSAYGFAWVEKNRIHPTGAGEWTAEDACLDNSTVVCLSASGKTGMSFAHQLRHHRPNRHQPQTIIGVCSSASKAVTEKSGFYDKVMLYDDAEAARQFIEENRSRRVVLLDFGARSGAAQIWTDVLSAVSQPFTFVAVGGEVKAMKKEDVVKLMGQSPKQIQANANELKEKGLQLGGDEYLDGFYATWDAFKRAGGIPGVKLEWREGLEAWEEGWERFCADEVRAGEGLVYRI